MMKKYILCFFILMVFFPALLCACDSKDNLYVYFNVETMTYRVGDKISLSEFDYKTNATESDLMFSVEKEKVAKVDNGKVVFLATGTTKLIVQVAGSGATATLDLEVKSKIYEPDFSKIVDEKESSEDDTISSDQADETDEQSSDISQQNENDNTQDKPIEEEQDNNADAQTDKDNTADQVDNDNEEPENNGQVEISDQSDKEVSLQDNNQDIPSKEDEAQTDNNTEQKDIADQLDDNTASQDNNQEEITDDSDNETQIDDNTEVEKEETTDDATTSETKEDEDNVEKEQKIYSFDSYIVEVTKQDCPYKVVKLTCKEINNGIKFELSILNGTKFNTYKRTVVTEGNPNNIRTDLTNKALTIVCKEKCNFYVVFDFTDNLGSMTIAFKKR